MYLFVQSHKKANQYALIGFFCLHIWVKARIY